MRRDAHPQPGCWPPRSAPRRQTSGAQRAQRAPTQSAPEPPWARRCPRPAARGRVRGTATVAVARGGGGCLLCAAPPAEALLAGAAGLCACGTQVWGPSPSKPVPGRCSFGPTSAWVGEVATKRSLPRTFMSFRRTTNTRLPAASKLIGMLAPASTDATPPAADPAAATAVAGAAAAPSPPALPASGKAAGADAGSGAAGRVQRRFWGQLKRSKCGRERREARRTPTQPWHARSPGAPAAVAVAAPAPLLPAVVRRLLGRPLMR